MPQNLIHTKFSQCKYGTNKKSILYRKIKGKDGKYLICPRIYNPCKLWCKLGIYHLCLWFPPSLHFFVLYLSRANICKTVNLCFHCDSHDLIVLFVHWSMLLVKRWRWFRPWDIKGSIMLKSQLSEGECRCSSYLHDNIIIILGW